MPTREAVAREIRDFLQHDENVVHVDNDKLRGYFSAAKSLLTRALPHLQLDREGAELERLKAAAIIVLSTTEQTQNPKVRRITAHADFTAGCEILARLLGVEIKPPRGNGRHA